MSESVRDLLIRGIAAAKAGEKEEARFFLEWVLRMNPTSGQEHDALLYLSENADDPAEKRGYLEDILALNPNDPEARRALAILDRRLKPEDIVDPDRMAPASDAPQAARTRRYTCPQCGARLTFTPDGQALACQHCGTRTLVEQAQEAEPDERDLLLALATAQGHSHPVAQQVVACEACGASFTLAPETISLTCPFCASAQTVGERESRDLIPPEGIIPFSVTEEQAREHLNQWLGKAGLGDCKGVSLVGVYLPVWAFTVGGEVDWRGEPREGGWFSPTRSGLKPVHHAGVLVPATRKLAPEMAAVVDTFSLDSAVRYDPRFLADWPAETYEIALSDASLEARRMSLERARSEVVNLMAAEIHPDTIILRTPGLAVESFRLILVPVWIARCTDDGEVHEAAVNGQTGDVRGERRQRGLAGWLSSLLE